MYSDTCPKNFDGCSPFAVCKPVRLREKKEEKRFRGLWRGPCQDKVDLNRDSPCPAEPEAMDDWCKEMNFSPFSPLWIMAG
jgi:hypothetical protein